jgi:hypothetical protein
VSLVRVITWSGWIVSKAEHGKKSLPLQHAGISQTRRAKCLVQLFKMYIITIYGIERSSNPKMEPLAGRAREAKRIQAGTSSIASRTSNRVVLSIMRRPRIAVIYVRIAWCLPAPPVARHERAPSRYWLPHFLGHSDRAITMYDAHLPPCAVV